MYGLLVTVVIFFFAIFTTAGRVSNQKIDESSTQPGLAGLNSYKGVTKHLNMTSSRQSRYARAFTDPDWQYQWYLHDYRAPGMRYPVMDHNVVPVHRMGFTGKGITVAVIDNGIDHEHPDLEPNIDLELSYDMMADMEGSVPRKYSGIPTDKAHGTMVAGIIAMVANNSHCGAGIAYDAKIANIRLLGLRHTERQERDAFTKNLDRIDIYSCSYGSPHGPYDLDHSWGFQLEGINNGVIEGRNKKGAIYVFASGNGKYEDDSCATDQKVNDPFAIPIAAATQLGKTTIYSERCAAVMATTYSGGVDDDTEGIVSTTVGGGCTTGFKGTSAATPIASGIIALTLQANPELTYRDVMHLIAMTSEVAPLADNPGTWTMNGAGFWVSNDFGFGLLNAESMVLRALKWKNVPTLKTCSVVVQMKNKPMNAKRRRKEYMRRFYRKKPATIEFEVDACQDDPAGSIIFLEKFELWTSISYSYRGAISIEITSPKGTKTTLLEPRMQDESRQGFNKWRFTSVQNWGENPRGTWKIEVKINFKKQLKKSALDILIEALKPLVFIMPNFRGAGEIIWMEMILRGTSELPEYAKDLPRSYTGFRLG